MAPAMWRMCVLAFGLLAVPASATEKISDGRFEQVPVLLPGVPVQHVVVWFCDAAASAGYQARLQARLQALCDDGAMVVDIDTSHRFPGRL
ncbi:hypothetical protein [Stenotrophomonas sp. PS02298]|uniref:hypothetical protein n=1 Tax=Stenotrophomonas sp. PS02298 TaxID=2991424 RepID=UPI00249BC836|nr:hypothetical protein [Stenotrophomonas sp. PS02298]